MQSFKERLERGEIDVHHHHAEFKDKSQSDDTLTTHKAAEHSHSHSHGEKHDHSHNHSHSHGHTHAPYKHIGHPHGPRTMINENVCCCFMGQFTQDILDEELSNKPLLDGVPSCKR
jgi:sirohydrochlorin cobaltochelatase